MSRSVTRILVAILVVGASTASPAFAQSRCASLPEVVVSRGSAIGDGFVAVALAAIRGDSVVILETLAATLPHGGWVPSDSAIGLIHGAYVNRADSEPIVVLWFRPGGARECWSEVADPWTGRAGEAPLVTASRAAATARALSGCPEAAEAWRDRIARRNDVRGGFTLLVFDGNGALCYGNRDAGVAGDPIFVGIFSPSGDEWLPVTFEPCALEPAGPSVYVGAGSFAGVPSERLVEEPVLREAGPRRCYNDAVDVVLHKGTGQPQSRDYRYGLHQYQRYHATLQLGVIFSSLHDRTFGLRPATGTGTSQQIYGRGPSGTGTEYVVTVVFYAIQKQVWRLFGSPFHGRDIVNDNGFFDRLGGVAGVGLGDPGRRFVGGLTFEVFTGASAMAVWEIARVNELAGVSEGDTFSGQASDIPTRDVWKSNLVTLGVSLDLRYVTALFSKK